MTTITAIGRSMVTASRLTGSPKTLSLRALHQSSGRRALVQLHDSPKQWDLWNDSSVRSYSQVRRNVHHNMNTASNVMAPGPVVTSTLSAVSPSDSESRLLPIFLQLLLEPLSLKPVASPSAMTASPSSVVDGDGGSATRPGNVFRRSASVNFWQLHQAWHR
jgi:hypothetical protein